MIKIDKGLLHINGRPGLLWAELSAICKEMYNKTKEEIGEDNAKKNIKGSHHTKHDDKRRTGRI